MWLGTTKVTNSNFKKKVYRSEKYKAFIRQKKCLVCGVTPCDPHHVRLGGNYSGGLGIKNSDYSCVPLCRNHHTECHAKGRTTMEAVNSIDFKMQIIFCHEEYINKLED